jgi:hypothetical protein
MGAKLHPKVSMDTLFTQMINNTQPTNRQTDEQTDGQRRETEIQLDGERERHTNRRTDG